MSSFLLYFEGGSRGHYWPIFDQLIEKGTKILDCTVFENHWKSLIQHCEWNELRLHFEQFSNNMDQNIRVNNVDQNIRVTVFKNHRKSLIQRDKWATLHFERTIYQKCQKWSILATFWKPEFYSQSVLPDRSLLIELVENAKIEKFKCDILSDF